MDVWEWFSLLLVYKKKKKKRLLSPQSGLIYFKETNADQEYLNDQQNKQTKQNKPKKNKTKNDNLHGSSFPAQLAQVCQYEDDGGYLVIASATTQRHTGHGLRSSTSARENRESDIPTCLAAAAF